MVKGKSYTHHPQFRSPVRGLIGWYLNLLTLFYQHLIIVGVSGTEDLMGRTEWVVLMICGKGEEREEEWCTFHGSERSRIDWAGHINKEWWHITAHKLYTSRDLWVACSFASNLYHKSGCLRQQEQPLSAKTCTFALWILSVSLREGVSFIEVLRYHVLGPHQQTTSTRGFLEKKAETNRKC